METQAKVKPREDGDRDSEPKYTRSYYNEEADNPSLGLSGEACPGRHLDLGLLASRME